MYWKNIQKILIHKWFVFIEGWKLKVPFYLLLLHDWSKFLPVEFFAYARNFLGPWEYKDRPLWVINDFSKAWKHHWTHNKHHWEYWVMIDEYDACILMPDKYVREMVADWIGAGKAYTRINVRGDNPNPVQWYLERKDKIKLHPDTRNLVEQLLGMRNAE